MCHVRKSTVCVPKNVWHYLSLPWCFRLSCLWTTFLKQYHKTNVERPSQVKNTPIQILWQKSQLASLTTTVIVSINYGLIISLNTFFFFPLNAQKKTIHISIIYFLEKKPAVQLKQYQDSSRGFADRAGRMVEECCRCDGGTLRGRVGRSSNLRERWEDRVKFDTEWKVVYNCVFDEGNNSHLPMHDGFGAWSETIPFSWGCWQQRSGTKQPVGTMRHQACWRILRAGRLSPFCEEGGKHQATQFTLRWSEQG